VLMLGVMMRMLRLIYVGYGWCSRGVPRSCRNAYRRSVDGQSLKRCIKSFLQEGRDGRTVGSGTVAASGLAHLAVITAMLVVGSRMDDVRMLSVYRSGPAFEVQDEMMDCRRC
jgi:hypothetical protein